MSLPDVWFVLIAFFWTGYFVLEGFDFGVGMLLPVLARSEAERQAVIATIGPFWDGNEVWLIVAGGATFAAFPLWYATLFSGFYLPLLLILVALIARGVAFEYRGRVDSPRWRAGWDRAIVFGSLVPAVLWGAAFANIAHGLPIDGDFQYTGGLAGLLNVYALAGGLTTVAVFALHGLIFVALRTRGDIRIRTRRVATRLGSLMAAPALAVLVWSQLDRFRPLAALPAALAGVALLGALFAGRTGRLRRAFMLTAATIGLAAATLFISLYPDVMPSSTDPSHSLTVTNASSSAYTLRIMTVLALAATPVVLAYQGWTYWVFLRRVGHR
jgi:cytochrome d ubiquinol oxidase subunit II